MKEEDIPIVKCLKTGDERCFSQLFESYYALLSAFAFKFVQDLEVAKDIVQDLFVHMYENRRKLLITTSLKAYLFMSVRNRCLNHLEREKVHTDHHQKIKQASGPQPNLEEMILESELEQFIFQNVDTLPEQCKKIFLQSRVEGKKNAEIADALNISVRTVETQVSKALKILRERLKLYMNM